MNHAPVGQAAHDAPVSADPEAPLRVLDHALDFESAFGPRGDPQLDALELAALAPRAQPEQSALRPRPDISAAVFVEHLDDVALRLVADRIEVEDASLAVCRHHPRAVSRRRDEARVRPGVEAADAAAVGGDPVDAVPTTLQHVVDARRRQAVLHAVIGEAVAVEARESIHRAEPHEAARVLYDLVYLIVRQPVGNRVGSDRQVLSEGFD